MEDRLPDFSNRVVYVFFDSGAPHCRAVVLNPRFELQGGELFLVGGGLMAKSWGVDVPVGIAWSKVQWYSVFESVEAFEQADAHYKARNRKGSSWSWTRSR